MQSARRLREAAEPSIYAERLQREVYAHAVVKARYHKIGRHWGGRPVKLTENPQEVLYQVVESAAAWTCKHNELDRRLQSNQHRLPAALRKESVRTLDDLIKVADQLRRRLGRGS